MLSKENIRTLDGRTAGNLNDIYSRLVNNRVVKVPYHEKSRDTSFFLDKRFGFMPLACTNCDGAIVTNNRGQFTDAIKIDGKEYYMWVDKQSKLMRIYKLEPGSCCIEQVGDAQCIEIDGYFKFIKTTFVKGKPRQLFDGCIDTVSTTGVQINKNISGGVDAQFGDTSYAGCPSQKFSIGGTNTDPIRVGDYVFTYDESQPFVSGQTGLKGQIGTVTGSLNGGKELDIFLAWSGFNPGQEEGKDMVYKVFPDFGEVFVIDTCEGLKIWTDDSEDFTPTGLTNTQSTFVQNNNGNIVYVNKQGYINYGGVGTLQFFATAGNELFVGGDVIASPTFQQYILVFKQDNLFVYQLELQQDGSFVPRLNPTNINIGLYSKYAFTTYFNSFYFLGSNKRLYALSVSPTQFGVFDVKIDDMSIYIKGDLDMLTEGDEVYIQADNNDMKIFINGDYRGNKYPNKTKILIYDKDFKFWHTWISCMNLISGEKFGKYIGKGMFNNCGYVDGYDCGLQQGIPYSQIIEAYIGENELANTNVNTWQPKNITQGQIIVGRNSYMTNGNSFIELSGYSNCLDTLWKLDNPENICYIKMLKDFRDGKLIVPTEDMKRLLEGCYRYDRPCKNSGDSIQDKVAGDCLCPEQNKELDDYCVCIDNKMFFIAPFSKISFKTGSTHFKNMYKFRIVANGLDRIEYGGFLMGYYENLWMDLDPYCNGEWRCNICGSNKCVCEAYPEQNDDSIDYCDCN